MSLEQERVSRLAKRPDARPVWWTQKRVDNGLLRYHRDMKDVDGFGGLPTSTTEYHKIVRAAEGGRREAERSYPPGDQVLRFYESMVEAWFKLGLMKERPPSRRKKYFLTPEIELMLRRIYEFRFRGKERPPDVPIGPKAYARQLGVPGEVMTKFAAELGLSRVKEKPWSKPELDLLEKFGHFSPAVIQRKLSRKNYTRSRAAIILMRKRQEAHKHAPYYSAHALSVLFGVDGHMITDRWIGRGWLRFTYKGTAKKHDTKLIHQRWVKAFILAHPEEVDLKKVDQIWFLNLITDGKVKYAVASRRITTRTECHRPEAVRGTTHVLPSNRNRYFDAQGKSHALGKRGERRRAA